MPPLQELSWVQLVYPGWYGNGGRGTSKHLDEGCQMKASVMSCPDKDLRMEGNSGSWRSMEKGKADNKHEL